MDINIIHHKENCPKTHNPTFEVYMQIFKLFDGFLSQIYSICSSFSIFVEFFKKLIRLNLKLIKYTKKIKIKNPRCDVHMLPKKLIPKKLYLRLLFLGGFVCFHLDHVNVDFTILLLTHENSLSNNIRYK